MVGIDDSPTLSLVRSAFGPSCTLYAALRCVRTASPADLKRAYRKSALRHHPDRHRSGGRHDDEAASTLKFQAVSAAYRVLMDEGRRSVYDATGRVSEEDEDVPCAGGGDDVERRSSSSADNAPSAHSQTHWEQFFQSIFDEIISTGTRHAATASSYRGSDSERKDVLHYYKMCKGDFEKVVECILHGSVGDVVRWRREIVNPAVERGEVGDYGKFDKEGSSKNNSGNQKRRILEDSSSDDEEVVVKATNSGKRRLGKAKPKNNSILADTDDEEDGDSFLQGKNMSTCSSNNNSMSKRDKMDYRVAKKRKARTEKDIETANLFQSFDWGAGAAAKCSRQRAQKKNMGDLSDVLLLEMVKKCGNDKKRGKKR